MNFFLILLFPILLSANLSYLSNHNKELAVLESFDIEPSFLYDPVMNDMKNRNSLIDKDQLFFKAMNDAYLFIPAIKNLLTESNIPQELIYLAMAESNFNNKAYSAKRASGLWQFMPGTARHYGLKINEYVDERRDLVKSTKAAAKYLTNLHKQFGKWYLAAIAYNCGGGRLSRAIAEAGTDDLAVLIDPEKQYIPRESRNYIRKIVALALIGTDEQYMLKSEYEYLLNRANAYSISTIKLSRGESLTRVSKLIDIPMEELLKLNRHLKYDFVPPYAKSYDIYIPYIKLSEFKQKYYEEPIQNIYKVHVVRKGDNLSNIGHLYGVTYKVIQDFNKIKGTKLSLNQKIIIPIRKVENQKINSRYYYMVKKGDSLESISKEYRVSIQNIKLQNNLKSGFIKVGNRLKIYE